MCHAFVQHRLTSCRRTRNFLNLIYTTVNLNSFFPVCAEGKLCWQEGEQLTEDDLVAARENIPIEMVVVSHKKRVPVMDTLL